MSESRQDVVSTGQALGGALGGFLLGVMGGAVFAWWSPLPLSAPAPAPVAAANILDDAWIEARLRAFDKVCGPVAWHVELTKEKFTADCARPEPVGVKRVGR